MHHYNALPGSGVAAAFGLLAVAAWQGARGTFLCLGAIFGLGLWQTLVTSSGLPLAFEGMVFLGFLIAVTAAERRRHSRTASRWVLAGLWSLVLSVALLSTLGPITVVDACTACKSKLKNLGTALEMYASDNQGRYPAALDQLRERAPMCPAEPPREPLRGLYEVNGLRFEPYGYTSTPERYTLVCGSGAHWWAGLPEGYPQYTSVQGLIERP